MRKIKLSYLFLLFPILGMAQTEHLKFMGIPLNGTISQFQKKLQGKGLEYDAEMSKVIAPNKLYKGYFAGEKCDVHVYNNEKSKIVYRAKVIIKRERLEDIIMLLNQFKEMLELKYIGAESEDTTFRDYPAFNLSVYNDNGVFIGSIQLYINEIIKGYSLHIDYIDYKNEKTVISKNMEDL